MDKAERIAVYAGTFDPITNGHRDIVERALKVFDRVVVAVAESTGKSTLFDTQKRVDLAKGALEDLLNCVEVKAFDGLLVDYVREIGGCVIVRGLRAVSDYEYEAQVAIINRCLCEEIETVYLMTSSHCSFISSSIVKDVARNGGDVTGFVSPNVARDLRSIFGQ